MQFKITHTIINFSHIDVMVIIIVIIIIIALQVSSFVAFLVMICFMVYEMAIGLCTETKTGEYTEIQ